MCRDTNTRGSTITITEVNHSIINDRNTWFRKTREIFWKSSQDNPNSKSYHPQALNNRFQLGWRVKCYRWFFFSYQCINQIFKIEALLILFVSASELCPNAVHLILKLFSLFCNYFAGDTHLYSNFSPLYYRNIMFCYYRASPECWDHDRQYKRSISLVLHLDLSFSLKIN